MSLISTENLYKIIKEVYGISVNSIEKIGRGRADVYYLCTNSSILVLKVYTSDAKENEITREIKVSNYLYHQNFKTSCFISSLDNRYVNRFQDRFYTLQYYISGMVYPNHNAPDWMLNKSAAILGNLHTLLKGYRTEKKRFSGNWPGDSDYEKAIREHELIIKCADIEGNESSAAIIGDMQYKILLLKDKRMRRIFDKDKLTYSPTHGDYCLQQMIINNQNDIALIDFSSFDCLPIIWEIVRSYSFIDKECANGKINCDNLLKYIEDYENASYLKLSEYDRKAMLDFYAIQLLLSTGGYREYFYLSDRIKRTNFLRFGFWRTKLMHNTINNNIAL